VAEIAGSGLPGGTVHSCYRQLHCGGSARRPSKADCDLDEIGPRGVVWLPGRKETPILRPVKGRLSALGPACRTARDPDVVALSMEDAWLKIDATSETFDSESLGSERSNEKVGSVLDVSSSESRV